jgi:DNA-binding transcriptional LysR family regulator
LGAEFFFAINSIAPVNKKKSADTVSRLQRSSTEALTTKRFAHLDTMDPAWALYFSVVVEHASLSRAAEALSVSTSTVSRKLDELESSIGVRLFDRDTRNLRLTEAGDTYLHYVRKALDVLDEGRQVMDRYGTEVRGQLRVWCPPSLARLYVADIVVAFSALHPNLEMTLKLESQTFSLNSSDFDVGICVGMPLEDRAVISKLCSYKSGYVATPAFLKKHGTPKTAHDLAHLPIVKAMSESPLNSEVILRNPHGGTFSTRSKLVVNDSATCLHAILSGQYIGRAMYWECQQDIAQGKLMPILPELSDEKTIYSLVPSRKGNPLKVQMFVDFLKAHLVPQFQSSKLLLETLTKAKTKRSGGSKLHAPKPKP